MVKFLRYIWWTMTYPQLLPSYDGDLNSFLNEVIENKDSIEFYVAEKRDNGFYLGFVFGGRHFHVWIGKRKMNWSLNLYEFDGKGEDWDNLIDRREWRQVSPITACRFYHEIAKAFE